jgi:hypothetical protein
MRSKNTGDLLIHRNTSPWIYVCLQDEVITLRRMSLDVVYPLTCISDPYFITAATGRTLRELLVRMFGDTIFVISCWML